MVEVRTMPQFDRWIGRLKDRTARDLILARITRLHEDLEGDSKPVGRGVSALRIHFGPGYRVDLTQRGGVLVIVLCAGSKRTQQKDSRRAQAVAEDLDIWTAPGALYADSDMATKTGPFDVARYLDDPESIAAFLSDALDTGNPAHINRALGDVARAKGMTQLAKEIGVKREALYRALSETGNPQFKTVLQVVKAMGLRLSVLPQ